MTSSRDDRHRRAAHRLRALVVDLAAEVRARGGSLDWHPDLTEEERSEAEEQAKGFWPRRRLQHLLNLRENVREARRTDRLASTE
jgi:hypothetical protein